MNTFILIAAEAQLGLDFAHFYKESQLCQKNKELVQELSIPVHGKEDLHFSTHFSQNGWEQFKAGLWKQHLFYWRSPKYNFSRFTLITASSLLLGALLWQQGQKIDNEQDFFDIIGSMFIFIQFVGISNCLSIIPFIAVERTVMYRELFAGMYSSWAYSLSQVTIEIPYIFLEAVLFLKITYPAINYYWSVYKVFWYFYTMFCTLLYFNYFGLLLASLPPNYQMASMLASLWYAMFSLFSGFLIPGPKIPKWWVWGYWVCPTSWSLKAILTSQYGDLKKEITVDGEHKPMDSFLQSYYGYNYDDLVDIAIVLLAIPLVFASAFAFAIAKLNFQNR